MSLALFDRNLQLATADLEPEAVQKALAQFARVELGKAIAAGASSTYERFVNGRQGLTEDAVIVPGPIVYLFSSWTEILTEAISQLQRRIRSKSGRYQNSFIVIVGGAVVSDFRTIPPEAEVTIVNYQPYTRKLDNSGAGARRHFLGAYRSLRARFGQAYAIRNVYLNISSGVHPQIPYILKRSGRRKRVVEGREWSSLPQKFRYLKGRKEQEAGKPISYPALVITAL